jgi:tetratricopeptide (TPR) repeat protein
MQPRLGALAGTLRVRFVEALGRALPGPGWKPPASEAAAFLARFDEVNEEVRRRWFPDRPRLFLEEPRDDAGASDPDPLGAAMALLTLMLQEGASREAALHARIAGLHRRASQPEEAARAWRAVLRSDPTHPAAHHALAEAALAEGDHRTAEAHLGRIEAAHPGHALAGRLRQKLRPAPPAPKPG